MENNIKVINSEKNIEINLEVQVTDLGKVTVWTTGGKGTTQEQSRPNTRWA